MRPLKMDGDAAAVALSVALRGAEDDRWLAAMDAYLSHASISRHFSAREIAPIGRKGPAGVRLQPPPPSLWPNIVHTLHVAEQLRSEIGNRPLFVNSGYRDPAYNLAVGGSTDSMHKQFNALDLSAHGFTGPELADAVERVMGDSARNLGIGRYETFVHIDTRGYLGRPAPARWEQLDRAA